MICRTPEYSGNFRTWFLAHPKCNTVDWRLEENGMTLSHRLDCRCLTKKRKSAVVLPQQLEEKQTENNKKRKSAAEEQKQVEEKQEEDKKERDNANGESVELEWNGKWF